MTSHQRFQHEQFDEARDFAYDGPTTKTLVIASSERSGSHLLGQVLFATGDFGDPLEYMHRAHIEQWKERLAVRTTHEALAALLRRRTSPNGVFSIKLHYSHLRALGGLPAVRTIFPDPHIVVLRRRDTLKQAVSHAIAAQSSLWIGDAVDTETLEYDRAKIEWALAHAVRANANWRFDALRSGLPTLDLDHEDVVADVPAAIRRVAGLLDVEVPDDVIPSVPVTRRQSSSVNEQWASRFVAETAEDASSGLPDDVSLKRRIRAAVDSKLRRGRG